MSSCIHHSSSLRQFRDSLHFHRPASILLTIALLPFLLLQFNLLKPLVISLFRLPFRRRRRPSHVVAAQRKEDCTDSRPREQYAEVQADFAFDVKEDCTRGVCDITQGPGVALDGRG